MKEIDRSNEELRFAEIIGKAVAGEDIAENEKLELQKIATQIGAKTEVEKTAEKGGVARACYWVCQNNFMCNPDNPPPNCNCRKICI